MRYDLSTARKNPYAERLKRGYSIVIDVPPDDEYVREMSDLFVTDEELSVIKEFVANEERKRGLVQQ